MKKLLLICLSIVALACGESNRNDRSDRDDDAREESRREAAADEEGLEEGSGEAISPQLELDSADSRFEVDTISSPDAARQKAEDDSF